MKKITLSAFLAIISLISFSQDIIYKKDNTKIEAKILEINPTEIRYKLFGNPDGPLYIIYKSEVTKIQYPNGQVDNVSPERKIEKAEDPAYVKEGSTVVKGGKPATDVRFNRNILSFNLPRLMLSFISLSYEWVDASGTFGIKIPVGYNFAPAYSLSINLFSESKYSHYAGLALNIYPKHKKTISYFVGPYLEVGQFSYNLTLTTPPTYTYPTTPPNTTSQWFNDGIYYGCYINNGFEVLISKDFSFSFCGGPGLIRNIMPQYNSTNPNYSTSSSELGISLNAEMNLSYRF